MAFGILSPVAIQQFFDNNGHPLSGGKLFLYEAGTETPTPAYADVALTTPLINPIILDAAGRAPELFLGSLSYKQVLKTADDVTIWTADNIVTPTSLRSTSAVLSLTGTQHDVPIPSGIITFVTFINAAPLTVDGFANATPGQILVIRAGQFAPVHFLHVQGSAPRNQLFNFVSSGPTSLAGPYGVAIYLYDGNYWVLITHQQGQAIRVPFNAANFYATVGGPALAWTVESGDVLAQDYVLNGSALTVTVQLRTTTVNDGPAYLIVDGFPYVFRVPNPLPALAQYAAGQFESIVIAPGEGQHWVSLNRAALGPWTNGLDIVNVFGQFTTDVH